MSPNRAWLLDTAERTARTFVQGFLGSETLDLFTSFDPTWLQNVEIGGAAGVYAVLIAFAGKAVKSPASASFFK